jgi:hypothetical protein
MEALFGVAGKLLMEVDGWAISGYYIFPEHFTIQYSG